MAFEENLLRGIPLEEAAGFFLRIRGKGKVASPAREFEAAMAALPPAERSALLKSAMMPTAGAPPPGAAMAALPATAKGQQMQPPQMPALPPTAMGQNASPGMKMASDKSPTDTGKERAHASLSAEFEKEKHHQGEARGGLVGKLLGGAAGAAAMHRYGKGNPVATLGGAALGEHLGGQAGKHLGAGRDRKAYEKSAAAFKVALQETGLAPQGIEPALDPATAEALALQQAGDQAAGESESAYLRQQLEALRQESAAAIEQAQTLQSQQDMVEQQQAQYQAQVADATQKAMESQDQVLQQQQAAAAMRMAYQELRGKMLEAASAEPPTLTPTIGSQAEAAAASQAAGASSAPAPTAGPAGGAPNPGVPPVGMAPEGDDTVSTPASKNEPTFEGASSTTSMNQKEPSGDAKTPNKEVLASASRPLAKTADLRQILSQIGSQVGSRARAAAPYAAGGALLGAGIGAAEAGMSNEPLRQRVAELEAKPDRGYKDTLDLAQRRARLTVGEFAKEHPALTVGLGALGGAGVGAARGPEVVSSLKRQGAHLKGIGSALHTIFQKGAA